MHLIQWDRDLHLSEHYLRHLPSPVLFHSRAIHAKQLFIQKVINLPVFCKVKFIQVTILPSKLQIWIFKRPNGLAGVNTDANVWPALTWVCRSSAVTRAGPLWHRRHQQAGDVWKLFFWHWDESNFLLKMITRTFSHCWANPYHNGILHSTSDLQMKLTFKSQRIPLIQVYFRPLPHWHHSVSQGSSGLKDTFKRWARQHCEELEPSEHPSPADFLPTEEPSLHAGYAQW